MIVTKVEIKELRSFLFRYTDVVITLYTFLNKPYVNEVTLNVQNLSLECCQSSEQKVC